MGAARSETQNHPHRRARIGYPGSKGDERQPGTCRKTAGDHACHIAQTRREVRHPAGVKYQVTEPSLLLLIPAYNEERRIEPVLRAFASYFQTQYLGKFQLVVVLNGCRDNTLGVVERVAADYPSIRALDFPEPIGKGGALIEGLKLAPTADVVGYVDADGASPPEALHALVKLLDRADCVIGSRWLPGAKLHQAQTWVRRFASRCFHVIVEALLRMHIKDTQCPCKVIRRTAVEKIHSSL